MPTAWATNIGYVFPVKLYIKSNFVKNTNTQINYSLALKNIIYNDLIVKGYKVFIGKTKKGEIDFTVLKDNKPKYIQVSLYLENESTINREFGAFSNIDVLKEHYSLIIKLS